MSQVASPIPVIESLLLGSARTVANQGTGEWWDKEWTSRIYKEPQFSTR